MQISGPCHQYTAAQGLAACHQYLQEEGALHVHPLWDQGPGQYTQPRQQMSAAKKGISFFKIYGYSGFPIQILAWGGPVPPP